MTWFQFWFLLLWPLFATGMWLGLTCLGDRFIR
ncbi:hypothetical protein Mnod_5391 [Methylobacterium nodulans ORS 2060]|uniref:Uncharacterized protein n=1 Tax=Methylobacterium nodulans (strain LMG 21967 / CNCM I-2342 / ORS 2060) TaxID=460265 RepID=B8IMP3_METNO|nr:hypothetical protein Mnod_5391 [Methylobacterium nodulans ORS 2060]